jgi:plastocyanin
MQVPKKHFPVVGIVGLIVIAAAGGGIYYYQFVIPHVTSTYTPIHRLVFMTATIVEGSANGHGFAIYGAAYLNQSILPGFNQSYGPVLTPPVKYTNYTVSSSTEIDARVGDNVTFYIRGINDTSTICTFPSGPAPCQTPGIPGHGFAMSGPSPVTVDSGTLPCGEPSCAIPLGGWYTVTVTFQTAGTYTYFCYIPCSPQHGIMDGSVVVS